MRRRFLQHSHLQMFRLRATDKKVHADRAPSVQELRCVDYLNGEIQQTFMYIEGFSARCQALFIHI